MKRFITSLCIVPALLSTAALARAHGDDAPAGADVKVYVADKDRKPVDLTGMTAILIVEPAGGQRQTITLELAPAGGSNHSGLGHGGEVREGGDLFVELVFEKGHGAPAGHGGGGGHGAGVDHGAGHGEGHAAAHFKGKVSVTQYTCGMNGHPVFDKPGKCTRCPMALKPVDRQLAAVVVLRKGRDTTNVRGFRYPSDAPTSYADGLERIQRHIAAIEDLIQKNKLTQIHPVAEKISQVCQQLPQFAPEGKKAQVEATCQATVGLFNEIDEAADNNRKAPTVAAVDKYKAKLTELRDHAK